jgi:hypothetical protein
LISKNFSTRKKTGTQKRKRRIRTFPVKALIILKNKYGIFVVKGLRIFSFHADPKRRGNRP